VSVKIRLTRMGTKKRPYYRIIAVDSHKKRDGEFLENLGLYHPLENDEESIVIKEDRVREWLNRGAIPSHTVKILLNKKGINVK